MRELLLSIHLIFSQTRKARCKFRPRDAFLGTPGAQHDPLLEDLCRKPWPFPDFFQQPKAVYHLERDFPMLGPKLDFIHQSIRQHNPKGLRQLWRDQRNTLTWYTFWAVVFIGGMGIILTIAQVVIAALQLHYST